MKWRQAPTQERFQSNDHKNDQKTWERRNQKQEIRSFKQRIRKYKEQPNRDEEYNN